MNLRTILFSQYPALFLLAVLFLIAHLRVRKTSAVKSVLWVILFGAALAASVVCLSFRAVAITGFTRETEQRKSPRL